MKTEAGFTLFEVLVALSMATLVSLAGWGFYRLQLRDLARQSAQLDATEGVRAASTFIAREIRMAGFDPEGTALVTIGFRGLREAGAERLHLEWDADEDGTIEAGAADPNAESVLYSYDSASGEIRRTVAGVTTTLVKRVPAGSFSFAYFDLLGNALAMTGSPAALSPASRDLVASVALRIGVSTTGVTPPSTFRAATRVAVRSRILERL